MMQPTSGLKKIDNKRKIFNLKLVLQENLIKFVKAEDKQVFLSNVDYYFNNFIKKNYEQKNIRS